MDKRRVKEWLDDAHYTLHFTEDGSDKIPERGRIGRRTRYIDALPICRDLLEEVYKHIKRISK